MGAGGVGPAQVLAPEEKLEALVARAYLLRPNERKWVERIRRTVAAAHRSHTALTDRQSEVICDIFDRVRGRVGR